MWWIALGDHLVCTLHAVLSDLNCELTFSMPTVWLVPPLPPPETKWPIFFFRNYTNTNHSQASRTTLVLEKLLDGYDKRLRPNFGGNVPWYCYMVKKRKRFSRLNLVTIKKTQGDASGFNRIRAHGLSDTSVRTWSHWKWQLDIFLVKMCV